VSFHFARRVRGARPHSDLNNERCVFVEADDPLAVNSSVSNFVHWNDVLGPLHGGREVW